MIRWIVAGCAVACLGGCAAGSVREPPAELIAFAPQAEVKELWSADVGAATKSYTGLAPVLDGTMVFATGADGRVNAFAADSGKRQWETDLDVSVSGATGAGAGMVLVGTKNGGLIALDEATGKQRWAANLSSQMVAPAVAAAGIAVAQTVDGKLVGLAAADGKRVWVYERAEPALSLRGTSTPVIAGDRVITGFAAGRLVAVQLADGKLLWELPVGQPQGRNEIERLIDVDASPLVVGDMLYAASYQGKLIAVNLQSGSIVWSRDVSIYSGLAADAANVYVSDDKDQVWAFDRRSGASVWKQDRLRGRALSAPAVVAGYVAVGDFEGYMHWLSPEDGRFVARRQIGSSPIRAPAVVAKDTLYVASHSGVVAALQLKQK